MEKVKELIENISPKIDENTIFDQWYGIDFSGRKVKVDPELLSKYVKTLNNANLLDIANNGDAILLPDGTRFVRSLEGATICGWDDIYDDLKQFVDLMNQKNSSNGEF